MQVDASRMDYALLLGQVQHRYASTTTDKDRPWIRFAHFGNVVIHPDTVIGENCSIAQGVLLGSNNSKGKEGSPTIGNNCCIFANAIVLGGIRIGNNVLFAPGSFCNFDVPDNCIVIGNPGKIIQRDSSPTAKHIVYPVEAMK